MIPSGGRSLALAVLLVSATAIGLALGSRFTGPGHADDPHPAGVQEQRQETRGGEAADVGAHAGTAEGEEATHAAPHGEGTGAEGDHHEGAPHLPTFITIIDAYFGPHAEVAPGEEAPPDPFWLENLKRFEDVIFAALAALFLGLVVHRAFRRRSHEPGRLQSLVEIAVEGLDNLVRGILGKEGRRFVPFVGTLFIYILTMNLMGLVPFLKSPTSCIDITASMAICVFLYVQYTGLRNFGFIGYLDHLAGNPRDAITWALVPIMIPLHVIGELAKPLSLSLRLFGNITGEDILLAVFVGLGAASLHFTHLPLGIPFQVPLIFLAILTSVIQALVFTLLSTVYFLLMQEHGEEH